MVAFLQKSGLSLSRLGLAPVIAREKGEWILGGLGQPFQEHTGTSVPSFFFFLSSFVFFFFFNFLQNHVSQTNRTLQTLSQALWREGEDSRNEQLPAPQEPYALCTGPA